MLELYPAINDLNMKNVKFELSKIMFDNIELFPNEKERVTEIYMGQCIEKLCKGENVEFVNPLGNGAKLSIYMNFVRENIDDISDKNKTELLGLFGSIKHMAEVDTWKSLFTNKEDLKLFVLLASQIVITGTGLNAFTQVKGWEKSDLAELVAYFESSTKDPFLKITWIGLSTVFQKHFMRKQKAKENRICRKSDVCFQRSDIYRISVRHIRA